MEKKEVAKSPEERAVNDFTEIVYKLYRGMRNGVEFGKSFRSRSRETPLFLYETGLIAALSFIYAKTEDADKKTYKLISDYIAKRETARKLEILNSTEGGYAAYLYLLLLEVSRLIPGKGIDPGNPLSCINALIGSERLLAILPSLLMPYLLEVKRLAEALLPSG